MTRSAKGILLTGPLSFCAISQYGSNLVKSTSLGIWYLRGSHYAKYVVGGTMTKIMFHLAYLAVLSSRLSKGLELPSYVILED